jgi:replicative DNA helicase
MAESSNAKIPPNSKESEMIVLGCMLTSIGSLNIAADMLQDADFYYSEHRIIFEVLKSCFLQDKPADVHLVAEELKRRDQLKTIGGVAYLTSLAQYAGTAAHIEEYTELVRNKSLLRRMIQSAQSVEKLAFDDPEDVTTTLDVAQQKFFQISQAANTAAGVQIRDLLSGSKATSKLSYLKELQERQELFQTRGPGEGTTTGIPTHYSDLDKLINGLSPSNLMILAARPAMGKTALALNIAENVCFKNNLPVGIFSLEMTADQLLHRIICSQAEVESDKIRTGAINGIEYQRIVSSVGNMQKHTMIIDDSPGLKITDLRARARRMREAHGIEFLVIDYLQLLSGSGVSRNQENRQMEVSEISRLLKTLARELNIPILCLSQLSRKVEERAGHRPMMSDLRESGCLTGDTEIKDAETGKIYTIKELAERKVQTPIMVYGVDKDLKMGKHKMIKAFYSGKKTVYEMKTRTGLTIKASANHPFLKFVKETGSLKQDYEQDMGKTSHSSCTSCLRSRSSLSPLFSLIKNLLVKKTNWIRLDKLSQGDQIAIPRNTSDIDWDEIMSITKLSVEDVYDATVEDVHNFVANDIVVHNSIEQDSDLVMFLLRREYYDPYDKPGTAELIVAKNRHGAIGNINFAFRKEIAQFADLSPVRQGGAPDNSEAFSAFSPSR